MDNKLLGKTIAIGIITLFAAASIVSAQTADNPESLFLTPTFDPLQEDWFDDFDNYTLGQFLDGDPEDGGWKGWDNTSSAGAYVVDDQSRSTPHSVEVSYDVDLVHEYHGYDSGQWTYTVWQYIPNDFTGESAFILLNTYEDGGDKSWSTQLRFNSITQVVHSDYDSSELPLITGEWVELRVEIDIDADIQKIYYDDTLLVEKSWKDGVTGGGAPNIGAVDLFANLATPIYYDDISLVGEAGPGEEPELEISDIAGGFGISAMIDNVGDGEATDTEWSITLDGGLIILGKETTGTIASIPAGESSEIKSGLIFGIGKPTITISAECAEGASAEETASGLVILFFVLGVS
jgi:hypothetical protein